jgi:Glyoxalase/Bleomycin resistance protein/Dioxygenase superfamily
MTSQFAQPTVGQIGIVVPHLEPAIEGFDKTAGIGPWKIFTNSAPPLKCFYHGYPASYKVRVAIARSGQIQVELIEYLEGDSFHRDFLASGRQGPEHIGVFVTDLDASLKTYTDQGIQVIQQVDGLGQSKDGRYAYLDTEKIFGTVLELIQESSQPSIPEYIYPLSDRR